MIQRLAFITVLAFLLPLRLLAATYEVVADFERPGTGPMTRLTYVAAAGCYFGTTEEGGANDKGTIFKMTPAGVRTTLISFSGKSGSAKGASPNGGLVLASDGALYGVTAFGGANDFGTVFKVTTDGTFTTLVEFTGESGSRLGSIPNELIYGSDGYFYGTTQAGGTSNCGTFFRYSPGLLGLLPSFYTLVNFTGTGGSAKGNVPIGPLVKSGNILFGVTQYGGGPDNGTVFRVTVNDLLGIPSVPNGGFVEVDFPGNRSKGAAPCGGLVLHSDGNFYGTAAEGGAWEAGTIFKLAANFTTTNAGTTFVPVYNFDEYGGAEPAGELLVAPDPNYPSSPALYGITSTGGDDERGTIFKFQPTGWQLTTLASFTGKTGAVVGDSPLATLIASPAGDLIGAASAGGPGDYGAIFQFSYTTGYTVLNTGTTATGWSPAGAPSFDDSGALCVPMAEGGAQGEGTLLKVVGGTPSVLANLDDTVGSEPAGGLLAAGGILYGVAAKGGGNDRGAIFGRSPAAGTVLLATLTLAKGTSPEGPAVMGPDGFLYAVAREGGSGGVGSILRIDPAGGVANVVSFTGTTGAALGSTPHGPLVVGNDGCLYGVTEKGGANDLGTIFRVTTGGTLTTLRQFSSGEPNTPLSGMTLGPDGAFYGTAALGGTGSVGGIFRFDPAGTYAVLANFTGASGTLRGAHPAGTLQVGLDGSLFGVAADSGANGAGTIFRILPDGTTATLFDFTGTAGSVPGYAPTGGIVLGPDGLLYGCTEEGGTRGGGVIFRIKGLGVAVSTDAATYPGLIATLNGRAQSGGQSMTVWFEVAILPELLPLNVSVPVQTTTVNGVTQFSLPVTGGLLSQLIYFRACAQTGDGTTVKGVTRSLTALAPLQAWKSQYLGDASAPDLGDYDHDGGTNLAEYGTVNDPTVPNSATLLAPLLKSYPEGTRLAVFVKRDPARSDVSIAVQAASSLAGPWTTVASSAGGAPFSGAGYVAGDGNTAGIKTVEIRDVPPADAKNRFMRVLVTH